MIGSLTVLVPSVSPGSKAMDYSNGLFDCQSPTSPFLGGLRVLHLLEDLRGVLELMDNEERDNLRCQIPDSTAEGLAEWLQGRLVTRRDEAFVCVGAGEIYHAAKPQPLGNGSVDTPTAANTRMDRTAISYRSTARTRRAKRCPTATRLTPFTK